MATTVNPVAGGISNIYNAAANVAQQQAVNRANRANWFEQKGLTGLSNIATKNSERAQNRLVNNKKASDWWSTWNPGKFVTEGGGGGWLPAREDPETQGTGITTGNMPYMSNTDEALGYIRNIDPNTNVSSGLNPFGTQSALGDYYGGYEQGALNNLNTLAGMGLDQYGNNVLGLREAINLQDQLNASPEQMALNQRNLAAIEGGLTPQSQYQYELLMDPIRQEQDRIREQTINNLGGNYSLWGNSRLDAENELARDLSAQSGSIMASLMQNDYQSAVQNVMQDKELQTAALEVAAGMGATNQQGQLAANSQVLQQTQQMGGLMMQQMQTQIDEQQSNIQNQFRQADQMGNMSQWMNEFDLKQREGNAAVINSFLDTLLAFIKQHQANTLASAGF